MLSPTVNRSGPILGGQPELRPQPLWTEITALTWTFETSPQSTAPTTTATVLRDKTKKQKETNCAHPS